MYLIRSAFAVGCILISSSVSADPSGPQLGAAIAFLGTKNIDNTYTAEALSISVVQGSGTLTGGAWVMEGSVATGVASDGAIISGPDFSENFVSNVCLDLSVCEVIALHEVAP